MRGNSLWGHETCEGCADIGAVPACERSHWGLRWSSLWGHETCEGCAEMSAVPACERSHWGLRWSYLWGHGTCEGCAQMEGGGMRFMPLGPSVELPMGPRNV